MCEKKTPTVWAKVHRLMRKNVGKPTLLEEMQKEILWLTGLRQTKHHLQSVAVLMEFSQKLLKKGKENE